MAEVDNLSILCNEAQRLRQLINLQDTKNIVNLCWVVVECQMHCLLAECFTHVCLISYILFVGKIRVQDNVVLSKLKLTAYKHDWVKLKLQAKIAFGILISVFGIQHSAKYPCQRQGDQSSGNMHSIWTANKA